MLHLDIPSADEFRDLWQVRADACVSLYVPTTPFTQQTSASRIELGGLLKTALAQLEVAGFDKRRASALRDEVEDLIDDDEFWAAQANSLAVLATPDQIRTFRLANALRPQAEVSDRFHLKPLLRAITFAHVAFVLALSEERTRLVEVFSEGPPVEVRVPDLPRDAASAAGKASINDRSPSGRITGSEGKKVRLVQFARKVDSALRPVLAAGHAPLFLAGVDPLLSIFRSVSNAADLAAETIPGNADRLSDAELALAVRPLLDRLHARELADFHALFALRSESGRATTDLSDTARAAAFGAIDTLLVDIDASEQGAYDEATGRITLEEQASAANYGVIDAVAAQALATGARVMGVRAGDLPAGAQLAAILRYAV